MIAPETPSTEMPAAFDPALEATETAPAAALADPLDGMLLRIWLRVRRRKAWLDSLNRMAADTSPANYFQEPDTRANERAWQKSREGQPWNRAIRKADQWLTSESAAPLNRLKALFRLSDTDVDLLQTAVALRIDPALGAVFGYLQGNSQRTALTTPLASRLFGEHESPLPWRPNGPLASWRLVRAVESSTGEPESLIAEPVLPHWLVGEILPDASIRGQLWNVPPQAPLSNWPHHAIADSVKQALDRFTPTRIIITGPDQSGRATLAACALNSLGGRVAQVDTGLIKDEDWPETFVLIHRFARWAGITLIWRGSRLDRPWPTGVEQSLIQFLVRERDQAIASQHGFIDQHLEQPRLTLADKNQLWREQCVGFAGWDEADQRRLAGNYRLNIGQIATIARRGASSPKEAIQLAKEATRNDLGELGQLVNCPFVWDDLVLKPAAIEALRDLAFEARERVDFWENPEARRIFPRGTGLTALFTGDPGTGKTMAAQIIAAELQLDLYRVDLARVVSKYIGETAKHLRELFIRAAGMSAILLFDEADSLFAKRSEVKDSHDRYANADTGYLLQLLEEYRGLALLATNRRGNLDPAFFRRLRYVFDFPRPGPGEREQIWLRVMTVLLGPAATSRLEPVATQLGAHVEVSPAQIKNALLAAIFIAKRQGGNLERRHLVQGLERELAKEGRSAGQHVRNELS